MREIGLSVQNTKNCMCARSIRAEDVRSINSSNVQASIWEGRDTNWNVFLAYICPTNMLAFCGYLTSLQLTRHSRGHGCASRFVCWQLNLSIRPETKNINERTIPRFIRCLHFKAFHIYHHIWRSQELNGESEQSTNIAELYCVPGPIEGV